MHIGKRMARLNSKTCRFDIGSGGEPELTPQDIAAALSFVTAGIGRELLCKVWWPDGAKLQSNALDRMLKEAQLNEWTARESAMYRALARVACATVRDERGSATQIYDRAHQRRWPAIVDQSERTDIRTDPMVRYEGIRRGAVEELVAPRTCTKCSGRGESLIGGLMKQCVRCDGQGHLAHPDAWRARMVGVKPSSYGQRWAAPYEWFHGMLRDELAKAEDQLKKALKDDTRAA